MELKKGFSLKYVFVGLYFLVFAIYIIYGLQPVKAYDNDTTGFLEIPSIELAVDVTPLKLTSHELKTPDEIVGSFSKSQNKTLLIGHSTTVFKHLHELRLGELVHYNELEYNVVSEVILEKTEIDMNELLASSDAETLVIMTCAGKPLSGGDATHRLIIVAEAL